MIIWPSPKKFRPLKSFFKSHDRPCIPDEGYLWFIREFKTAKITASGVRQRSHFRLETNYGGYTKEDNYHLINQNTIAQMKRGAMLINTSRGKLIDTKAVIQGIKTGQIGHLGIDVYEMEDDIFFRDLSDTIIQDDTFLLLQSFPNVLITSHQGYFTEDAMNDIANTTVANITDFEQGIPLKNEVKLPESPPA